MAGATSGASGPAAGARALRAFATELAVSRIRDLEFYGGNREICWWMIACNPAVTLEVMKKLPDKPWAAAAGALERNPSFSAADIREFRAWLGIARSICFSGKKDFTFADLERAAFAEDCRLDAPPVNSRRFSEMRNVFGANNPNMTWDIYRQYFAGDSCCLQNPAVANARTIRENPAFLWNCDDLCRSINVSMLFRNPAIGAEALAELEHLNPGLSIWNWASYSWSDAVTWDIVKRFWDKPWDMAGLSRNPKVINWARLSEWPRGLGKEPDLDASRLWNWRGLSANPAVATWQRVCEHPELPWWSEGLAINREVCVWEAIAAPPPGQPRAGPSCWKPLQYCFVWSKVQFVGEAERVTWARRWMAAWRIQRLWLPLYYTPGTAVWKRRMLRELGDLQGAGGAAA